MRLENSPRSAIRNVMMVYHKLLFIIAPEYLTMTAQLRTLLRRHRRAFGKVRKPLRLE